MSLSWQPAELAVRAALVEHDALLGGGEPGRLDRSHAGRFEVTDHHPMSWLITIARNTAIDRLRAQKTNEDIDDHSHYLASTATGPEGASIAASDAARIRACLDELPPDRRDAVRRAYLDGDSYADLAEHFGIPLNTVRTWLRRGLMALRECMSR